MVGWFSAAFVVVFDGESKNWKERELLHSGTKREVERFWENSEETVKVLEDGMGGEMVMNVAVAG